MVGEIQLIPLVGDLITLYKVRLLVAPLTFRGETMIAVHGTRQKGDQVLENCPERHNKSVGKAVIDLVKNELGFGGQVRFVSETKITIETYILNCIDTTTYEGDRHSMKTLYKGLSVFNALHDNNDVFNKDVDRVMHATGGKKLLLKFSVPWLNINVIKIAAMCAAGFTEDEMVLGMNMKEHDLLAAVELKIDSGCELSGIIT